MKFDIKTLIREIYGGKSLGRSLQNCHLSNVRLKGRGIDLGAKSGESSYYRFLKKESNTEIMFSDLSPESEEMLEVNLEEEIPVPDDSQDFLLLMNVLEHLYDHDKCLSECYRTLKLGGKLIGAVPFLHRIHPDPDDFYRYTTSSLDRMLKQVGFAEVKVVPLGTGPFTAAITQVDPFIKPRLVRGSIYTLGILADRAVNRLFPDHPAVRSDYYPLAFNFVARK